MSKSNYRPGSAGEKEEKEYRIVKPILFLITALLLCAMFVFNGHFREAVKFTDTWLNVIGAVLVGGSCVPVLLSYRAGEEGSTPYAAAWGVMLVVGFLIAAIQGL